MHKRLTNSLYDDSINKLHDPKLHNIAHVLSLSVFSASKGTYFYIFIQHTSVRILTSNDFVFKLCTLENEALDAGVPGIDEARDDGKLYMVDALVGGAM